MIILCVIAALAKGSAVYTIKLTARVTKSAEEHSMALLKNTMFKNNNFLNK